MAPRPARGALLAALLALPAPGAFAQDVPEPDRFMLGREVFLELAHPGCPICHTLSEAGTSGEVGPNLDILRPSYDRVLTAITKGVGPMLPYEDLSDAERDALAHYVSLASGGS